MPRQSLRALVHLHVVQQYVEGVTVRVRSEDRTAIRSYRFRQRKQVGDDEHTHERGRLQDPSFAGVKDQLNENGSISPAP